jgi:hypothetical protein
MGPPRFTILDRPLDKIFSDIPARSEDLIHASARHYELVFPFELSISFDLDLWRLALGFPFALRPLQKSGDIRLMSIEDQGGDNNAYDEISLRITPEKSNQDRNGRCAGDRPQ